jgi:hypothetical protein
MIFLFFVIATGVTIYSVNSWRVSFLNFILEMKQTHTDINFNEDNKGAEYSNDEIRLGYIPEGFTLDRSDITESYIYLMFKNESKYFTFTMDDIQSTTSIDTENAGTKKININDFEAYYSTNNNVNILVWHNNQEVFQISGNIEEKEIINIAKKVKKIY